MKFKNVFANSLFVGSIKIAKANAAIISQMILFDVLFVAAFYSLLKLLKYLYQNVIFSMVSSSIFLYIVFSLLYYLAMLFVYIFFKYCVLDLMKSLFKKGKFSFNRLGQFYMLNIVIAGIFFAIMLVLNYILVSVRQDYAPYIFIFLATPYILFLYIVVNISHSVFSQGSFEKSVKDGFGFVFSKINSYRETILAIIIFAVALWLVMNIVNYISINFASKNYKLYLSLYPYLKQAIAVLAGAAFYFVLFINRISFYRIFGQKS